MKFLFRYYRGLSMALSSGEAVGSEVGIVSLEAAEPLPHS